MTRDDDDDRPSLARRELIAGGLLAGAALATVSAEPARAARPASGAAGDPSSVGPQLSPLNSTIASPTISGYSYRHKYFFDFSVEAPGAERRYVGFGCYSTIASFL